MSSQTSPADAAGSESTVAAPASGDDDVGMPGILTRTMAGELLKTILLTTAVLVSVIAFGAAIKPLARNLLGGTDILRYVALASVPMLQYALPFSAGFGATLVMHRLATDNEIVAMSAAGLSHFRIMRPVMLLGVAILVVMLVLVNLVVPVFFSRMESMLARDVTRLLASAVERGEAFDLGDTRIYADAIEIQDAPEGTTATTRLVLVGVAAIQTGEDGAAETEFTADYATLDVHRIDGRSILKLVLGDATVYRAEDETLVRTPAAEPRAISLGRRFEPNPKMFTLGRMLEIRENPRDYWRVRVHLDRIAELAALHEVEEALSGRLLETGRIELRDPRRNATWTIVAEDPDREALRVGGLGPVTVERREADGRVQASTCPDAAWTISRRGGVEVVDLDLSKVDDSEALDRLPRSVRSLEPVDLERATRPSDDALLDWATARIDDQRTLPATRSTLKKEVASVALQVDRVTWDIDARIQQRFAQAVTAPLLLLLGAILAIQLRHATPLSVYVVAFLPAIADILLISGGEQMLRRGPSFLGGALLWSGNLLLVTVCIVTWLRLRRH